jgi:hypothetical protein
MKDLFYLLPDHGFATFTAMGRVVAAFTDPEEAYSYACRHPETFVRFPNGTQLQSRYSADTKGAFMARATAPAPSHDDQDDAERDAYVRAPGDPF